MNAQTDTQTPNQKCGYMEFTDNKIKEMQKNKSNPKKLKTSPYSLQITVAA